MHLINYDKKLNAMYIQFHNDMSKKDIKDATQKVKDIIRKELRPQFTLIFNLEGVEEKIIKEYINYLKQVQIIISIRQVSKIIRIGTQSVLKIVNDSFSEIYRPDEIPVILQFPNTAECVDYITDLDMWFGTMLIK